MNWVSHEGDKKGWELFWKSITLPIYTWIFIFMFVFLIFEFFVNLRNIDIFEIIISFIPFFISFKIGIIVTLGTLLLTVFINAKSEFSSKWETPYEYIYRFAYQKYVIFIAYFLGISWHITFIYRLWLSFDIKNIHDFLGRNKISWNHCTHGVLFGSEVLSDSDAQEIPKWIFLFLSWFVLSIVVYMNNYEFLTHDKVMYSYREIKKIKSIDKSSYKISRKIYDLQKISKHSNLECKMLTMIFPRQGDKTGFLQSVSYAPKVILKSRRNIIIWYIIILIIQIIYLILIPALTPGNIMSINVDFDLMKNPLFLATGIFVIIFVSSIGIAIAYFVYKEVAEIKINTIVYPKSWVKKFSYIFCIVTVFALIGISSSSIMALFSMFYRGGGQEICIILFALIGMLFPPVTETMIFFYILNKKVKYVEELGGNILKKYYHNFPSGEKFIHDNNKSIFRISASVLFFMKARKSYIDYMRLSGKNHKYILKNADKDLHKAWKASKHNEL